MTALHRLQLVRSFSSKVTVTLALLTALSLSLTLGVPAQAKKSKSHSLYLSRLLWGTVDVCNATDQPNTIGIRGSIPSDGQPHDTMYMRFRVQYLESQTNKWVFIAQGADSGFLAVGSAKSARQAGRSFVFVPAVGKPAFTLRGVVDFQWRHGAKVVHSATRATAAGHKSLAGADPAGFSAATCSLT